MNPIIRTMMVGQSSGEANAGSGWINSIYDNTPWTDTSGVQGDIYVYGVAADDLSNSYVVGERRKTSRGTTQLLPSTSFVAKYNVKGDQIWHAEIADNTEQLKGGSIALDNNNNIVATFYQSDITGTAVDRSYVVKFSNAGSFLWQEVIAGSGDEDVKLNSGVAIDALNNIYCLGYRYNRITQSNQALIIKYSPSGIMQWQYEIESGLINGIAVSGASILISTTASDDCVVTSLNSGGSIEWQKLVSGTVNAKINVDKDSNIFVAGLSSTVDSRINTVKLDPDGNLLWQIQTRPQVPNYVINGVSATMLDQQGTMYIAAAATTTRIYDRYLTPGPSNESLVLRVDPLGNVMSCEAIYAQTPIVFFSLSRKFRQYANTIITGIVDNKAGGLLITSTISGLPEQTVSHISGRSSILIRAPKGIDTQQNVPFFTPFDYRLNIDDLLIDTVSGDVTVVDTSYGISTSPVVSPIRSLIRSTFLFRKVTDPLFSSYSFDQNFMTAVVDPFIIEPLSIYSDAVLQGILIDKDQNIHVVGNGAMRQSAFESTMLGWHLELFQSGGVRSINHIRHSSSFNESSYQRLPNNTVTSIDQDSDGNYYTTSYGGYDSSYLWNSYITKYDRNFNVIWMRAFATGLGSGLMATCVKVTSKGNLIVLVSISSLQTKPVIMCKLDSSGQVLLTRRFSIGEENPEYYLFQFVWFNPFSFITRGYTSYNRHNFLTFDVDADENVYIPNHNYHNPCVLKLDSILDIAAISTISDSTDLYKIYGNFNRIKLDGDVMYALGSIYPDIGNDPMNDRHPWNPLLVAFSKLGYKLWSVELGLDQLDLTRRYEPCTTGITVDETHIFICGFIPYWRDDGNGITVSVGFVACFDKTGNIVWQKLVQGAQYCDFVPGAIEVHGDSIVLTGQNGRFGFIHKLPKSGNFDGTYDNSIDSAIQFNDHTATYQTTECTHVNRDLAANNLRFTVPYQDSTIVDAAPGYTYEVQVDYYDYELDTKTIVV